MPRRIKFQRNVASGSYRSSKGPARIREMGTRWIVGVLAGGGALAAVVAVGAKMFEARSFDAEVPAGLEPESPAPETWRKSPLASLPQSRFSILSTDLDGRVTRLPHHSRCIVLTPIFELATTGA
jgi:hypothetical protein